MGTYLNTGATFSDPRGVIPGLDTGTLIGGSGAIGSTASLFRDSLVNRTDIIDIYKFTVASSSIVNLDLNNFTSDLTLRLLDSAGNTITSSNSTGTTPESIRVNLAAGDYYARVSMLSSQATTDYDLGLRAEAIVQRPENDNAIGSFSIGNFNNSRTSASYTDFVGNQGETGATVDINDYYTFILDNNGSIDITLSGLTGDANLELRNNSGIITSSIQDGTATETINRTLAAGTYYLRVYPGSSSFTNYNLNFQYTADQVDNAGNSLATANTSLNLNTNNPASASDFVNSADNRDYYLLDLTSANFVNGALVNISATGNTNLQILNSGGGGLQTANNPGEDIIMRSLSSGIYYILVTPETGVSSNYTLTVGATALQADLAANNRLNAKNINPLSPTVTTYSDFVGNIDQNDFYKFSVDATSDFNLLLEGLTDNADVQLINNNNVVIASSTNSSNGSENITTTLSQGDYFIRIYTSGLANTFYNLRVSAVKELQFQIVETIPGAGSADPKNLTAGNNILYFTATDGAGSQIWSSNGTTVNRLTNINPGNFNPGNLTVLNNNLYFTATDSNGKEIWVYNTSTNTAQILKDINLGSGSSDPSNLTVVGNNLYFTANDTDNGRELWVFDGTNVRLVKDINSGIVSSNPRNLVNFGGQLYFTATNSTNGTELWTANVNGTDAQVIDIVPGSSSSSPGNLTVVGNTLYFTTKNGLELWKYESGSASRVKDFSSGSTLFTPTSLTAVGNTLYFTVDSDNNNILELWKSNGSDATTTVVSNALTGFAALNLTNVDNTLYFAGLNSANGLELWKSDNIGTGLVKDIWVGTDLNSNPNNSSPGSLVKFNGLLYFVASSANNNREVWSSDGTELGTQKVSNINATTPANPANLTVVGTKLFFTANDGTNGKELWVLQ